MRKRISRRDLILITVLLAAVFFVWLMQNLTKHTAGAAAVVTVDGNVYGTYPLSKDQEIPIIKGEKTTNLLVIKGGRADITEADCPDRLCVHQKPIAKTNETIVCLPNKVVVSVEGSAESGIDSIAK